MATNPNASPDLFKKQLEETKPQRIQEEVKNLQDLSGAPKEPKTDLPITQLSPSIEKLLTSAGKARSTRDIMGLRSQAVGEQLQATQAEGAAAQQVAAEQARLKGAYATQEAEAYKKIDDERQRKMAQAQIPDFNPTQDNLLTLGTMASLIAVVGAVVGQQGGLSGIGAVNAMAGMMKGYQAGRKDVFEMEKAKFDKNMQTLKAQQEKIMKEFEAAYKRIPYDMASARADMEMALVKANSPLLKATYDKQGAEAVLKLLDASAKDVHHLESMASKALGGKSGGRAQSAINERFQNTVIRSANETLRSLELMENIGIDIGKGGLGGVVGKGTMTTEALANISRKMTSQDQLRYNAAAGGMALELAYVMNGGYKPNETQVTELKNLYLATPQDSYETAAFKFADVVAKLKAAVEVAPAYTEDQKKNNQMLLEKVQRYATPEEILQKISGEPVKQDPYVRAPSGNIKTVTNQAEYNALQPGEQYYEDGKLYRKPAK